MDKLEPLGLYRCTEATPPGREPISAELELVIKAGQVDAPPKLTLSNFVDQFGDCN